MKGCSRASRQLALGVLVGSPLRGALLFVSGLTTAGEGAVFLSGVVALMLTAGLLAAAGPARLGLATQPMEALREG
jgi:hypothetical protein